MRPLKAAHQRQGKEQQQQQQEQEEEEEEGQEEEDDTWEEQQQRQQEEQQQLEGLQWLLGLLGIRRLRSAMRLVPTDASGVPLRLHPTELKEMKFYPMCRSLTLLLQVRLHM